MRDIEKCSLMFYGTPWIGQFRGRSRMFQRRTLNVDRLTLQQTCHSVTQVERTLTNPNHHWSTTYKFKNDNSINNNGNRGWHVSSFWYVLFFRKKFFYFTNDFLFTEWPIPHNTNQCPLLTSTTTMTMATPHVRFNDDGDGWPSGPLPNFFFKK